MAELSVAHRAALAQVIERVPDRTLSQLGLAAAGMPGERARTLESMLVDEIQDRRRRARAMACLAPMFRPRPDGVASTTFPAAVLPRLWKIASASEPALLPLLDSDDDRELAQVAVVCGRICVAAAAALRDRPEIVWPEGADKPEVRQAGLTELASCCDLGPLVSRSLPSLKTWVGRPDENDLAELRLLVRDSAAIAPEGAQRLLEILFSHLTDAALILRLMVHSSTAAVQEAFLSESELAVFVDRLIVAVDTRVARISTVRPGAGGDPMARLKADVAWVAGVLAELDSTIHLHPGSAWGKRARDARMRISQTLSGLLGAAEKAVDRALPLERVKIAGRMTRLAPKLDDPLDTEARDQAAGALALLGAIRASAQVFGCESRRIQVVQGLTTQLTSYADLALEAVNAGEVIDEASGLERIEICARFLDLIEAKDAARTVRRRGAVAGVTHRVVGSAAA